VDPFFQILEKAWPFLIVGAPGLFAAWKAWTTQRSDLVKIAQDAAGAVIQSLRDEAVRLAKRLEQVESELDELRKEHAQMMANKDARITLLEGEQRQLQAQVEAYRRILASHDLPDPGRPAFFELQGGALKPHGDA
jgi:hypothetical protein